ncbi:MAG TPA: FAD-dependent oxidoreductase [Agriterribacter sp.]|nr:FAD-dependent oxidoreductase [Agriterribacter sp.]
MHFTDAIISEPLNRSGLLHKNCLIWETKIPYLYCRTTKNNRIVVGGKDDDKSALTRDAALPQKAKALEKTFRGLFPGIILKTDFEWTGSLG